MMKKQNQANPNSDNSISNSDSWDDVAEKLKDKFDVKIVTIQAGETGNAFKGWVKDDDVTFREVIGTIEFAKTKMIQNH